MNNLTSDPVAMVALTATVVACGLLVAVLVLMVNRPKQRSLLVIHMPADCASPVRDSNPLANDYHLLILPVGAMVEVIANDGVRYVPATPPNPLHASPPFFSGNSVSLDERLQ